MHRTLVEKRAELADLCRNLGIRRLDVFGSAVREDFDPLRSDADFLVEFRPETAKEVGAYSALKDGLESLLGRPVDIVEREAVEQSRNYLRRRRILTEAQPIYVAG